MGALACQFVCVCVCLFGFVCVCVWLCVNVPMRLIEVFCFYVFVVPVLFFVSVRV